MLPRLGPKRNPFVSSKPPAAQRSCAFLKEKSPERRTAKRTRLFPRTSSGRTPIRREESAGAALPRAARSPPPSAGPQSAQNRGGQTRKDLVSGASPPGLHALIGQPGAFARRPACGRPFSTMVRGMARFSLTKPAALPTNRLSPPFKKARISVIFFSAFQQGFARRAEMERLPGAAPAFVLLSQSHKAVRGLR